ncbi:MAG: DUF5118 domain-containing protein, partial [Flavobacteriaceae bacterium]
MNAFKNFFVYTLFFFVLTLHAQKPSKKDEDSKKSLDSLTQKMSKQEGLIISYRKKDKLFLEISESLLNKDLLMVTRFTQLPGNYQAYINAGSKTSE